MVRKVAGPITVALLYCLAPATHFYWSPPRGRRCRRSSSQAEAAFRSPFSQQKLRYLPKTQAVLYRSKMKPVLKRHCEVFPVLDWIAAMTAHVPNQGEHLVRDYGWYSNVSRGKREKAQDQAQEAAPEGTLEIPPPSVSPALKQRWAQLIKKVYEADPLRCPRCEESMRIIAVIDQPEVLPHLGLRPYPSHAPPSRAVASLRLSPRWTVLQSLNNEGRGLGTTSTRSWAPVAQKVPRPCSCAIFLTDFS